MLRLAAHTRYSDHVKRSCNERVECAISNAGCDPVARIERQADDVSGGNVIRVDAVSHQKLTRIAVEGRYFVIDSRIGHGASSTLRPIKTTRWPLWTLRTLWSRAGKRLKRAASQSGLERGTFFLRYNRAARVVHTQLKRGDFNRSSVSGRGINSERKGECQGSHRVSPGRGKAFNPAHPAIYSIRKSTIFEGA
jgi:hypothetical protein